jgi:ParB/RepB/Spo0J family partition protein
MVDLKASIAAYGIIQPLVVRHSGDLFEIVAGVQRWMAAGTLGLDTVPCVIIEVDDLTAVLMQAEENLKRSDMHPLDEALYCAELASRGLTVSEIAERLGLPRRRVVRRMGLLALCEPARMAYLAGKLDEDAALAIARVTDANQQARIVDAVDASSLQPEEVPGYVSRTFAANLDDVPWRMTDDALVPSAGPCSACQRRSDVQRDLFPEHATGIRCLDVPCYRAKMDAAYAIECGKAGPSSGRLVVLSEPAHTLFIPVSGGSRPVVVASSGMVDAEGQCRVLEGRTWLQAVTLAADKVVPLLLARDQDGRPRYLFRETEATRAVRGSDAAIEDREAREAADPTPSEVNKQRTKIHRATLAKLQDLADVGDHDTWAWIVQRLVSDAAPRVVSLAASALAGSLAIYNRDGKEGLLALAGASNRGARRVATAITVFSSAPDDPQLDTLARMCGTTIADIVGKFEE